MGCFRITQLRVYQRDSCIKIWVSLSTWMCPNRWQASFMWYLPQKNLNSLIISAWPKGLTHGFRFLGHLKVKPRFLWKSGVQAVCKKLLKTMPLDTQFLSSFLQTVAIARFLQGIDFWHSYNLRIKVYSTQRKKGTETVPLGYYCYKRYPFFQRGTLFSLIVMFITPLSVGYQNSTPRGTKGGVHIYKFANGDLTWENTYTL